jgi:hypothetical protein
MARKAKIVCRICGPEGNKINRQSYRDHLRLVHDDTSGDLREWGQASLAFTAVMGVPRPATRSRSRSPLGGGGDRARSRSHSSAQDPGEEERGRSRGRSRSSEADRSSSEESDRSSSVARDRGMRAGRKGSTAAGRSRSRGRVGERERSPSRVRNNMEPIMIQVDRMIKNIGIEVDVTECNNNGFCELGKKLDAIERYLITKESMKEFEESVKDLKEACGKKEQVKDEKIEEKEDFKDCKSLKDIENIGDFEYVLVEEAVVCTVCEKKVARYTADQEDDFHGKVQAKAFVNLKISLKKHLTRRGHVDKMQEARVKAKQEEKYMGREKRVAAVLGSVSYYLLKKGRPQEDFTTLVNLLSRAGVDVGDLNHSTNYVAKFAPVTAAVVQGRVASYFQTPLLQTGRRPPAKLIADKATWKHETRMVSGMVTVVPDTPQPLQAFFLASKACPGGTGDAMTESLVEVVDGMIERSQYLGLAADGATLHCNVGRKLGEHFGKKGHDDYDPLHKAGLVHVHMLKDKQARFDFMNNITESISAVYSMFNMGQEFAHFFSVAKELAASGVDIQFKMPRFFSETRFANYSFLVMKGFIENYPAVVKSLAELQEAGMLDTATANDVKKADRAAGLQAAVYSLEFVLTLSAICDLYSHYAKSVNVLQIVNILPHEKYDIFEKGCREKLKEMQESVVPEDCPCSLAWKIKVGGIFLLSYHSNQSTTYSRPSWRRARRTERETSTAPMWRKTRRPLWR